MSILTLQIRPVHPKEENIWLLIFHSFASSLFYFLGLFPVLPPYLFICHLIQKGFELAYEMEKS